MEAYIQAAEQLKEDIADEYMRAHPNVQREQILEICPHGKLVFDNIEIVFKNSAKYKLFSERVQGKKRSLLEGDELLYAYLNTGDNESYDDCLESAKCCKKISYFLFTSRYDKFTLVERNKYSDLLRKHENRLPNKAVEIYNTKKALMDLMVDEHSNPRAVHPLVVRFVEILHDLLESQQRIYKIEYRLAEIFREFLDKVLIPQFQSPGFKYEPVKAKALVQTLKELIERGLEFEPFKDSITVKHFESVIAVLGEHMECMAAEMENLTDVTMFLKSVVKYADRPKELDEKIQGNDPSVMSSIRNQITSKVAEWLSS